MNGAGASELAREVELSKRGTVTWLLEPQRRRWLILALIFCAMVLNYVDRQILSVLKPTLKSEFGLDDGGYATLVNVFMMFYAAAYVVGGWLVDRFGAGKLMLVGLVTWSCACAMTGFARTIGQLTICRGGLGLAEPLGFPAQLRAVRLWFPASLRATANSICAAGSTIGAIVAAPLIAGLSLTFGWRAAFVVPGALGLVVAVAWWRIYRDPTEAESGERTISSFDSFASTADEKTENVSVSDAAGNGFTWPQLWRTRSLWGILLCRFISDPVWYFCLFWLPGYLQERSGLSLRQIGWVGWIPFLAADLGGVVSSVFSDRWVKRGSEPLRARKLTLIAAAAFAPICAATPYLPHAAATLLIFSLVGAVCLTWLFNLGVVVAEAFPLENVGSVWGIAGACGAVGAMAFNLFVGQALGHLGAEKIFLSLAIMHPLAAIVLSTMVRRESRPFSSAKT